MKILITGSSGCTGKALQEMFSEDDIFYASSKDADLTSYEQTYNLFKDKCPQMVIHLASRVGRPQSSSSQNCVIFEENMLINFNVIKVCRELKVQRLINVSSIAIFYGCGKNMVNAGDIFSSIPVCNKFGYSSSKMMSIIHSYLSNKQFPELDIITVIPSNIYGPFDVISQEGHVVGSLIDKIYQASIKNLSEINLFIAQDAERQFLYNFDLAKCCMNLALDGSEKKFLICAPPPTKISTLCSLIAEYFNYQGVLNYSQNSENKTIYESDFDGEMYTSIEEGLIRTLNNYYNPNPAGVLRS